MRIAIKSYNWQGEVIGYQCENMSIPITTDGYYRVLQREIEKGECQIIEPKIDEVEKAYDKHGELSGYLCQFGFVPIDINNDLYKLICTKIENSQCVIKEPQTHEVKHIVSIIISIVFSSPWKSIDKAYETKICYPPSDPNSFRYNVRFLNVPLSGNPDIEALANFYQLVMKDIPDCPLHHGVLEITIPVCNLRKILRVFMKEKTSKYYPFLSDLIEMHYRQTKRGTSEGPDINWLIRFVHLYIGGAIMDIGNRALEANMIELGDYSIKHINEHTLENNTTSIYNYADNTREIGFVRMMFDRNGSSYKFTENELAVINDNADKVSHDVRLDIHLKKITYLQKNGFYMEALCLLNGYLEVFLTLTFLRIFIRGKKQPPQIILRMGHNQKLEMLDKLLNRDILNEATIRECKKYLSAARQIYLYRNLYLHDLNLPDKQLFLSNPTKKEILDLMQPFVEPYQSHCFKILFNMIEIDYAEKGLEFLFSYLRSKHENGENSN